ncbi:MAG: universal stress protein [Merismopedia sp. SIO2A8]|nr:universal stress protein [Merismopedia sp. SIO2A8]
MLISIIWMIGAGFIGGQLARRVGVPPLMGMIIVGIVLGPDVSDRLSPDLLDLADPLRTMAVTVILMRAGLGLDRDKLHQQGSVAIRLGFLPALTEAIAIMITAIWLFDFNWLTGLLLGCIVGAESPAVIVPGMLRLKSLGWGVSKGIPDVILTGSALSDVLILLLFSLLINILTQGAIDTAAFQRLPFQVIGQVAAGLILGYVAARSVFWILVRQRWTQNVIQDVIIVATLALGLVAGAQQLPYFSGYLAVMALGFFLVEQDPPLARRLRLEFNNLWSIAEIVLFVLMGASIQLRILENTLLKGITLLVIGLLVGRMVGWWLSTLGSNWTWKERLFLLPGNSAKATVQAAIGAMPLSLGIDGGEVMLAIAALSILVTAPIGAWAIQLCAPYLLSKDPVDPTKIAVNHRTVLLATVDRSTIATRVLRQTADLARRCNGEVIVLHVIDTSNETEADPVDLRELTQQLLLDIRYQFMTANGHILAAIQQITEHHPITEIVMGRRNHQSWQVALTGSASQVILESRVIPVLVIEETTKE